jgi:hypothetical protein
MTPRNTRTPKPLPSQEALQAEFCFDPDTGVLTRRKSGHLAGYQNPKGYRLVSYQSEYYLAHRLIFKMVHDIEPPVVDHADSCPANNRISNLRAADGVTNRWNGPVHRNSKTGIKNVHWCESKQRYFAAFKLRGKVVVLGRYTDLMDAAIAAAVGRLVLHGEFARHS